MRFTEVIWAFPSFRTILLNRYPDIHHVPPFAGLLSQNVNYLAITLTYDGNFQPYPRKIEQEDLLSEASLVGQNSTRTALRQTYYN